MTATCANPTFGLNPQAVAVMTLLSGRPPSFAPWRHDRMDFDVDIQTFPWFAGKAKGIALVVRRPGRRKARVITVTEHIQSDGIEITRWDDADVPLDGPTVAYRDDILGVTAMAVGSLLPSGAIGAAADRVYDLMAEVYEGAP